MGGGCAEGGGAGAVATLGLGGMYNDVRRTTTKDRKKQGKYVHVEQTDDLCSSTKPKKRKKEVYTIVSLLQTIFFYCLAVIIKQQTSIHLSSRARLYSKHGRDLYPAIVYKPVIHKQVDIVE